MAVITQEILKPPTQKKVKDKTRAILDEGWKEALRLFFKDFVELCWPSIYDKIDWSQGYTFLEQEFFATCKPDKVGKKLLDKLVKVHLLNGESLCALVHVEAQAQKDNDLSKRVYVYRYRIFERFGIDIATMVILTDNSKTWRPNVYEHEFWGTRLKLEYPILKIIDFRPRIEELRASKNPFALVIMAQLAELDTKNNSDARLVSRFALTKHLYGQGWKKPDIMNLLRCLESILILNKTYTLKYIEQVKQFEEETNVSYMTVSEGIWLDQGIEKGIEKGVQYGEAHLFSNLLQVKFKNIPREYIDRVNSADASTIDRWGTNFVFANSIDEVFKN